jgi:DNA-binding transcriptional MocR family regulator
MGKARSLDTAEDNGGYAWVENSFIQRILPKLSGQAVRVYLYLISQVPYSRKVEPLTKPISAATIAETLKSNRRSIVAALKELSELGVIEKIKEPGLPNRYLLLATCAENDTGDEKNPAQGCAEIYTPPVKNPTQVEAAKPYGARLGTSPKNILRINKSFKREEDKETVSQTGPRRV